MNRYESARVRQIKASPAIAMSTVANSMKAAGQPIIDLSVGEPDFNTPAHILKAAYDAAQRGETRYTAPDGTLALKDAVIEKFKRENALTYARENISCGTGAKQIIFNALMATLEPEDEVIFPAPYWVSYTDISILLGGTPKIIECPIHENFKLTPEKLEAAITPKSRWLILNSPSNPSGATYTRKELMALGAVVEKHPQLLVLSDEIYEHIYFEDTPFTSFASACPNLADQTLIVNGVSKAYAMTGWRLGYAAGPAGLVKTMSKIQSQSTGNPCSISQAAAIAALTGPQDFVASCCKKYRARRDLAIGGLRAIDGVTILEPSGAFYGFLNLEPFIGRRTPNGTAIKDDTDLAEFLLKFRMVAGVPGAAFGLSPYFRMSFALSQNVLDTAISRISDALNALD